MHGRANRGGERRGVVGDEEPSRVAANENICGLHGGFVEPVGKGGGDVLRAGDPPYAALQAHPYGAEGDAHALRIGENARPTSANLIPAKQQLPAGLDAFDGIIVRPDSLHLRDVERFESGIEALVRGANFFFGRLFLRCGLCGHDEVRR